MKKNLDVSVIIPYFNAAATIMDALRSVDEQTVLVREVIVIDDGSDQTPALDVLAAIRHLMGNINIVTLSENGGVSRARNIGISLAQGKYVALLDADDCWHPQKLEIQIQYMEAKGVEFTAHGYQQKKTLDYFSTTFLMPHDSDVIRIGTNHMLFGSRFATPTVVLTNRGDIQFDELLKRSEDYHCWFKLMKTKSVTCHCIPLDLAAGRKYAIGVSGLSSSVELMHEGYMAALKKLRQEKHMRLWEFIAASLLEVIKLPVRKLRIKARKC